MKIELLNQIEVIRDLPETGIRKGMRGAVVEVFTSTNLAYEVEFLNKSGDTIAQAALLPEQVRKLENISYEEYHGSKPD